MADPTFMPQPEQREERNYVPMLIGLGLVILVVAAIAILGRTRQSTALQPDPYAQNLQVSDMRLSRAENFVGGTVTYLDFALHNAGQQTVAGAQVEATFYNTLGEVVQKEVLPVRVLQANQLAGYPDLIDLAQAPITPGQSKAVRITLEHVSSEWNQAAPDLRFLNLRLR